MRTCGQLRYRARPAVAHTLGQRLNPATACQDRARAKFDETVDLAVNLGIDPRRGDQMVRGVTILPHGTGRAVRVGVFAQGTAAEAARQAGAARAGRAGGWAGRATHVLIAQSRARSFVSGCEVALYCTPTLARPHGICPMFLPVYFRVPTIR